MRTITRPHPPVVMRAMFRRGAAKEASTNKPTVGGDAGAGTGPGGGGGASAAARAHPYASRPTTAWDKLKVKQTVLKATNTVSPDTPKPDGHTRFVCISGKCEKLLRGSTQSILATPYILSSRFLIFLIAYPNK